MVDGFNFKIVHEFEFEFVLNYIEIINSFI